MKNKSISWSDYLGIAIKGEVTPTYNLAICNPELAKQWHPTKNGQLTPYDVTPNSNLRVWWICCKGHESKSSINNRTLGKECGKCHGQGLSYIPIENAKEIAAHNNIKSREKWEIFVKKYGRNDIPLSPRNAYKDHGWVSWDDFLNKSWLSLEEAKKYVLRFKLKNIKEWKIFKKSNNMNKNIPRNPNEVYSNSGWISWADFLGTQNDKNIEWVSFEVAKSYVRGLKIKGQLAWQIFCKSGIKRKDVPASLNIVYKNKGWKGWKDFLGTSSKEK